MQNIMASENEGLTLLNTYKSIDPDLTNTYEFIIPVYENMPKVQCKRPKTENIKKIEYEIMKVSVSSGLKVRANQSSSARLIGTAAGAENIKRLEKSTSKVDGYYWDKVITSNGLYGYVARMSQDEKTVYLTSLAEETNNNNSANPQVNFIMEENYIINKETEKIICEPNMTLAKIQDKYTVKKATDKTGKSLNKEDSLKTGDILTINDCEYVIEKLRRYKLR